MENTIEGELLEQGIKRATFDAFYAHVKELVLLPSACVSHEQYDILVGYLQMYGVLTSESEIDQAALVQFDKSLQHEDWTDITEILRDDMIATGG